MSYKDISYLELWWPFCSAGQNYLCNFDVGYQEEQFCGIFINLNQLFRRCHLKVFFLIWSSGSPPVQWSGTILCNFRALAALLFSGVEPFCAILKEGIMRKIHVKLYEK